MDKVIKIFPDGKQSYYFNLYIHKTQKSLRAYWDILDKSFTTHSSARVKAFCLLYSVSTGKCIGEIHLTRKLPLDIISHECIHAVLHWGRLKNLNIYEAEEQFCYKYQVILKSVLKNF